MLEQVKVFGAVPYDELSTLLILIWFWFAKTGADFESVLQQTKEPKHDVFCYKSSVKGLHFQSMFELMITNYRHLIMMVIQVVWNFKFHHLARILTAFSKA